MSTNGHAPESPESPESEAPASSRESAATAAAPLLRGTDEHYQDADLYDHEYRRRRDDVRWYRDLASQVARDQLDENPNAGPLRILELGCGTGRLLVPLVRDGHQVVGVDRSAAMLARCRVRLGRAGRAAAARAQLVRADFCRVPLAEPGFALVLCPFNGFMHLYTRADVERFLSEVRRLLRPGGMLAFDVVNPDPTWLGRDPTRRWARTRFRHPRTGARLIYSTSHVYDPETQIAWIRLFYERADDRAEDRVGRSPRETPDAAADAAAERPGEAAPPDAFPRTVLLAHRQFFPAELEALLHYAGFSLAYRAGGFDGQPLSIVSSEQVICARVR